MVWRALGKCEVCKSQEGRELRISLQALSYCLPPHKAIYIKGEWVMGGHREGKLIGTEEDAPVHPVPSLNHRVRGWGGAVTSHCWTALDLFLKAKANDAHLIILEESNGSMLWISTKINGAPGPEDTREFNHHRDRANFKIPKQFLPF